MLKTLDAVWKFLNTPIPELLRKSDDRGSGRRSFNGATSSRLVADWIASSTSIDSELYSSLPSLRNRSRQLCRDNDYAKGAKREFRQNVIHRGVGFQAQVTRTRGTLDDRLNNQIESLWKLWKYRDYCHTAGKLCFADIERLIMDSIVESGEILVRLVRKPFAGSPVPLALELIEADQLAEDKNGIYNGNEIRMGVEIDEWGRPTAYWIRNYHPGDYQFSMRRERHTLSRIPASDILHIFVSDRPGQTRGVPWFHSALLRLRNLGGYEEAELIAARVGACSMGFIQTEDADLLNENEDPFSGEAIKEFQPGQIEVLAPGEKFQGYSPTRPNDQFESFMRSMLRGVAAGLGMSYESLSRDFSQTNYSSSRLALLEDRDHYRMIQDWLIASFHRPVYLAWLDMAVLSGAISMADYELAPLRYQAHQWQPRGWSWVDPAKEVNSTLASIRGGITTLTDVAAAQGTDIESLLKTRAREIELAKSLGLVFDLSGAILDESQVEQAEQQQENADSQTPSQRQIFGFTTSSKF